MDVALFKFTSKLALGGQRNTCYHNHLVADTWLWLPIFVKYECSQIVMRMLCYLFFLRR